MKATLLIATAVTLGLLSTTLADDPASDKTGALMQAKLGHSKALLEGLAKEDYTSLKKHSQALTVLSLESDWNVLQTAEYRRLSDDFRRATKDLASAADRKNLDGATLAYVGVTMKCVECHKYVRSVQVGQAR